MTVHMPTDAEIQQITDLMSDFESKSVEAMAYIRDIQDLKIDDVVRRFSNINAELVRRYMRPSYNKMRPIHFMAAFSWVTNVPATSFYLGSQIMETWHGMDNLAAEALVHIGGMPFGQFDMLISCIYQYLTDAGKESITAIKDCPNDEIGVITEEIEQSCAAPDVIDFELFARSYYRSVAITAKAFRTENNLSYSDMSKVLGLSDYHYKEMEKIDHSTVFPLAVGARVRFGFNLKSHSFFTREMDEYGDFHKFRLVQEYRESLLLESLKYVHDEYRFYVIEIIKGVANAYKKSKPL